MPLIDEKHLNGNSPELAKDPLDSAEPGPVWRYRQLGL